MKRRQFLSRAATGAAAVLAGTATTFDVWAQAGPEVTKLALGFGLDPVFAPHMVAIKKGWFRDAGFTEVTTKTFTGGALAGEALVGGEIALWTPGNLPPISMTHSGVPVVVLGTNCLAMAADKLVARKDANVRTPEDLYRIAHRAAAGFHGERRSLLPRQALQPRRQAAAGRQHAAARAARGTQLGQRAGDAVLGAVGLQRHQGGRRPRAHRPRLAASPRTRARRRRSRTRARSSWRARSSCARIPIATRKMMEVLLRGQRYVADPKNKEEVLALFVEQTKQDHALTSAIWGEYAFDPVFDDRYVRDMQRMTDYLVASGRLKSPRHPLDYTYTDPLAAADPALVKVPGRFKV